MGIYGALSSAVTGLRAQAHALENISGNIANSQTTGYKRIETDFLDLIPDAPISRQVPGAVLAQSRGTNDVQGDIKTVANETFIALSSNGFFVVEPKIGQSDGQATFAGTNFFTRRGDFEINKDGLLVNGAGYYLKGLPVDTLTGNISGSVPGVIKLSNAFLPAQQTNRINYQANLPQLPKTGSYKPTIPQSELIKPWTYANPSPTPVFPEASGIGLPNANLQLVPARSIGSGGHAGDVPASSMVNDGDRLTATIGGASYNLWFDTDGVPSSAVELVVPTHAGSDPTRASKRLYIEDADLIALKTDDNFYIGSTYIPFSSAAHPATPAGLAEAIEAALGPDASVFPIMNGYTSLGRIYEITYPAGISTPDPSATGTGVTYNGAGQPAYPASSARTSLTVSEFDIVGLHRSTEPFEIGGVPIAFSSPAYAATAAELARAIDNAFSASGVSVTPAYPPGALTVTITYPAGYRPADTVLGGVSTLIDGKGDIDTMLASMQAQLRDLTGDNTLFVKLKNGEITVSAGLGDANPLDFSSVRTGAIGGDILGLATGPYDPIPGSAMTAENSYADLILKDSDKLVVSIGGTKRSYSFDTDGRQTPGAGEVEIDATGSLADILATIQTDLRSNGGPAAANAVVTYAGGSVRVAFPGNYYYDATISGSAASKLGIAGTYQAETGGLTTILASDADRFTAESISGGAITVYAKNGAPADVQLRWAKVDSDHAEGQDTWNLYYLSDSTAQGASPMWTNAGQQYVFRADGSLVPPGVSSVTISNLKVNGVEIGEVELRHDINGISQFADVNGTVNVSTLNQNGYGAGEFVSVAINDNGRVVATYSNGERIDMAQVVTAEFNAMNSLKRLDGGVFASTSESGEAILDLTGSGIIGGALEASNTDISDEFTKLIVTQQAYAAGTRIVSAADKMLQESLDMVR